MKPRGKHYYPEISFNFLPNVRVVPANYQTVNRIFFFVDAEKKGTKKSNCTSTILMSNSGNISWGTALFPPLAYQVLLVGSHIPSSK